MAHEIETYQGAPAVFTVVKKPWHNLGTVLDAPPTVIEGIRHARLDWGVETRPLLAQDSLGVPTLSVPNRAVVRTSDENVLGVVGAGYKPYQNIEAFEWFQPFIDEGVAQLESAGSLFNGKRVWVMAKVQGRNLDIGGGDEIERYILLQNSHDGSTSVRLGFTPVRVVCNNTLQMAVGTAKSQLVRITHTKSVKEAADAVRGIMNVANENFEATELQFRRLANIGVNEADLREYVKKVFKPEREDEAPEAQADKPGKVLDNITRLFEEGRGADLKSAKGTMWGAYNAVIEYMQYYRGDSDEKRMNRLWFERGRHNPHNKALALALAAA